MKYLVTGGCGFIGSNFLRYVLHNTDVDVVNVDCLTYAGCRENVQDLIHIARGKQGIGLRYGSFQTDVRDKEALERTFQKTHPDVVVHMAAESHVDRSIENADDFITTNVLGTYNMLEMSLKYDVKKFIQISTDEVYGQVPEPKSSVETDSLDPRSPYSSSKASGDLLALSYYTTHGLPVIVTRCCNNYGPYQFPEKLIPLFITNLIDNKEVPVYGDGKQVREWIHVDDHNAAVEFLIQHGTPGEIYNIGSGNEKTNFWMTHQLISEMDKSQKLIKHVEDRKGHDRRYSIDCSKLRALGWKPKYESNYEAFTESLKKTIKWYEENEEWWRPLK